MPDEQDSEKYPFPEVKRAADELLADFDPDEPNSRCAVCDRLINVIWHWPCCCEN